MKSDFRIVLLCIVAAVSGGAFAANATTTFSDAQAFEQLKKSGSDLSVLHRVEYRLRFKSEAEMEKAKSSLEALAFSTTTERDTSSDNVWILRATKVMYPVETDLTQLSTKVKTIAAEDFGTYEGWQAKPKS
jgi:regulator of ribonuclease activity B